MAGVLLQVRPGGSGRRDTDDARHRPWMLLAGFVPLASVWLRKGRGGERRRGEQRAEQQRAGEVEQLQQARVLVTRGRAPEKSRAGRHETC